MSRCSTTDYGPINDVSLSVYNANGYSLTRDGVSISPGPDTGVFQNQTYTYAVTAWGPGVSSLPPGLFRLVIV